MYVSERQFQRNKRRLLPREKILLTELFQTTHLRNFLLNVEKLVIFANIGWLER